MNAERLVIIVAKPKGAPPRHVSVIGWPQDELDRIALATQLSQLVIKREPSTGTPPSERAKRLKFPVDLYSVLYGIVRKRTWR